MEAQKQFLVYKSSAGSGKTYTLVKEYLKLVLTDPSRLRHILAITFTNAAAAEMKERIVEALGQIGRATEEPDDKGNKLLGQIVRDLEKNNKHLEENNRQALPHRDELIRNARSVLKQILHQYSDFSVSTIDSFVHRVIRTFAFDLRIPLNFEVELDAEALLSQAIDLLISRVGDDRELTRLLVSYMIHQADEEGDIRIEDKLAQLARTLMDEDSIFHVERLRDTPLRDFLQLAGRLRTSMRGFEEKIRTEAQAALDLIRRHGLPASAFYRGKTGIANYFAQLAGGAVQEKLIPNSYVRTTIEDDKWVSGSCSAADQAAIEEIREELTAHFNRIQETAEREMPQYRCEQSLMRTIFPLAVLTEVDKMLEEIKAEQGVMHLSDFNKRIAAIVSKQPVPFIYERLGERYKHYMIDEFQDTSLLQWQNLLPLVENALSEGHMSLVVGDGKQAIYRFRNGDVEQFALLPHLSEGIKALARAEWENTLVNNYRPDDLTTNWRSSKTVVDFNNDFFGFTRGLLPDELKKIYDEHRQKPSSQEEAGYVNIRFLPDGSRQELAEESLRHLSEIIHSCLDAGHPLSDITILCRANKEASMVARELLERQIPVISQESLLLNQSDEVNFFLAILGLLLNPLDRIAALEMLSFLAKNGQLGQEASLHQCLREAGVYRPGRQQASLQPGLEKLMKKKGIDFRFSAFDHLNVYDSCEAILRQFFASQTPPSPFVAFFMDAVFDFSIKHSQSYADFLSWWDEKGSSYSIVLPEGMEAIQVMTVHKAKGLQFPVVIHPFAHQQATRLTKKGIWTDGERSGIHDIPAQWFEMSKSSLEGTVFEEDLRKEENKTFLDMLNATYVAFTRPRNKLFILSKKEKKEYKELSVNGLLHAFLKKEGRWDEGCDTYEFGHREPAGEKPGSPAEGQQLMLKLPSRPWSHSLRMRSHQAERSLLIDKEDPLERGNLLHRLMESIHHSGEVDHLFEQLRNKGEIDSSSAREWSAKIHKMLAQPKVARYFSPGARVRTEAGIFDEDGTFYRPDRVVFTDDACVIMDYKSGRQYSRHADQINRYAAVLEKMGYSPVKKILLYLDEGKAVEV